jgi:hypothetical protein
MIKPTSGNWKFENPNILDRGVDKNYFYINTESDFYDYDKNEGFNFVGFSSRSDAVLLTNAKKMYEVLLKITQSDHESDLMEACNIADNLLEEMERQANEES